MHTNRYMVRWLMEAAWDRLNAASFEQVLATALAPRSTDLSLSLSLYIYIYIYM